MERRAEINRFAIFLFCLLVPLGSLAPTKTWESKLTPEERCKIFTNDIPSKAADLKGKARDLFEFYKRCVSGTFPPEPEKIRSPFEDMMEKTLSCPAFQENCCVLHDIHNTLQTLGSEMGKICQESPADIITANLEQLSLTVSEGAAFYTCEAKGQPQDSPMGLADNKTYIWWFLKRYQDITQTAVKLYSAEMQLVKCDLSGVTGLV